MKAFVATAIALTSAPTLASPDSIGDQASDAPRERKVCTRVEQRSGSRLSYRRVCRTPTEWREAYGPDWRQELAGVDSVEDQEDALDVRTRVHTNMPSPPTS